MTVGAPERARDSDPQTLFERLFESSPDAMVVTDGDGRITGVNAQVERFFGYTRQELLGQTVEILIPERFRQTHLRHRTDYSDQPRIRPMGGGMELCGRRKDGSEFPVEIMLSPLNTAGDRTVLSGIRDISERKRAEDCLHQSEQQLRLLVESVKDYAVFLLDLDGRILTWSPGAERIKGYKPEEIIGRNFSCFFTCEDIERGKPEEELRVAADRGHFEDESWQVRKDGSRFWAQAILTAIRDTSGKGTSFMMVTCDLTERREAENALILGLSNALLSNLDGHQLLSAISEGIQRLVPCDLATLGLYDSEINQIRVQHLDASLGEDLLAGELLVPIEGSAPGAVFNSRQPLVMNLLDTEGSYSKATRQFVDAGIKSLCCVPLVGRERFLGTLALGSKREAAFSHRDLRMLTQFANHVAIALDNSLAFRQITILRERLAHEKRYLEEELLTEYPFKDIIGESSELKRALKQVETVAATDATVLLLGETGTGKDLFARAIHQLSSRRERTFVKLNCAAIPTGLLESELFGYEKGAFTGAISRKIGRLELAHQGTLFLDEVGDLPLEVQPKLLRVLQEKEFERLGGTRTIFTDVRLIAATNRELEKMVADRQLRSDLYYRLKVFPISIPPLRERREDIPLLVRYFVTKYARKMNRRIQTIPSDVMQTLTRWDWPGNIRELEHFIERAVILSKGPVLRVPLADLRISEEVGADEPTLEARNKEHILRVLGQTKGAIGGPHGAAARLGLKRTTLNSKLKKLGIEKGDYM
ncbi:MAG TPA: sigma 54-interacting transcriptional regulator [Candidatus Limnocylindria bacterium]|nr:sigma 54-interacting transcriptional regulator [Candidatus Limnocylindria bacterium]